jgi:hypothetical protein
MLSVKIHAVPQFLPPPRPFAPHHSMEILAYSGQKKEQNGDGQQPGNSLEIEEKIVCLSFSAFPPFYHGYCCWDQHQQQQQLNWCISFQLEPFGCCAFSAVLSHSAGGVFHVQRHLWSWNFPGSTWAMLS